MPGRRRGRRPASEDTRTVLIEAARAVFTEQGYAGATVRQIAARAGMDPSMINHWFGGKDALFTEAVLQLPFRPADIAASVLDGPVEELGERFVRTVLRVWDSAGGGQMTAVLRSFASNNEAVQAFREQMLDKVFLPLAERLQVEDAAFRATLCASQMAGLALARYALALEPLASADPETVVTAIAPNLQRYLTGDLG
ncbi:TetR/AcrR family transcriptional regulator [Sciscionella sediminilitoris]|uniref:TetR/AcrR family transcriptional regulator n=1 Tax=Sciscionella sediminilitoris TaxID=1445613 RepID=UPI0004DFC6BC|nr:TetR family transcriptional regulator [Sciscionella sp. SE31]